MNKRNLKQATLALHAGFDGDPATNSCAVPIYSTSSYLFDSTEHAANLFALKEFGNIYSRLGNPTVDVFEKRVAALDGGVGALAFASGMAAITAAICTLAHAGENIAASTSLYGGTVTLFSCTLPKLGITVNFFDPEDHELLKKIIDDKTRAVFIESIGNPKNDIPDCKAISEIAHNAGIPFVVDNTVLTPVQFRPIDHGADIVVYSATKYLGGHGTHVGGVIVDSGNFVWADDPGKWPDFCQPDPSYHGLVFTEALAPIGNIAFIVHARTHWLRDTGACLSPWAAFLLLQGIETLHLRVPSHIENANTVANYLSGHEKVLSVNHPSLKAHPHNKRAAQLFTYPGSPIVGFEVKGGIEAGAKLIDNIKLARHLANIGDAKTLIIHPASTTHQQLGEEEQLKAGVTPGYIRLCVGIEDVNDIIADLEQALSAV
ncbi:MAG: aminotransferase class I/II-fold pyridoxal phosphate-dependent enzyme [Spirochaetes bacterium]|nr:aminotransferase class I/II-fold pyridoxal phosphate-dependent enzyme [Spirochaetota bacterium]MBN2772453.1 aminotransferase class I/II-fold pyridoxal phosphate-dependent enzyme [Spirochaetota bacterium]